MSMRSAGAVIERVSSGDLRELASDHAGSAAQVGAVLVLGGGLDLAAVRDAIGERVQGVPRLRQRLVRAPFGGGHPVWVDDPGFDIRRHVTEVACPAPGDEGALLAVAAGNVTRRLPIDRPLWSITLVTALPDDRAERPEGRAALPAGQAVLPEGQAALPDGRFVLPESYAALPVGHAVLPVGHAVLPVGPAALPEGRAALIMTLHHVVADGIGGLAVLAHLVDGATAVARPFSPGVVVEVGDALGWAADGHRRDLPGMAGGDRRDLSGMAGGDRRERPGVGVRQGRGVGFPRPSPARRALFRDAAGARLRALTHLPRGIRPAIAGLTRGTAGPPRSSLNQPTGPHRRLAVARADLAAVRRVAHAHDATVNDVVLTAVSGGLHAVLQDRGESVDRFVISVPVSARREASAGGLGNRVAIMAVPVIVAGDPYQRLSAIARTTRDRKPTASSESAALLGLAFRALARLGVMRWVADRQRMITTFVTNLRGPEARLSFLGAPITEVIPVSPISGNVTVGFAVLSYAGSLVVTVVADPLRCPDLPVLAAHVQGGLDRLTAG
jgi:WS/DGAT/MGAT family acyltransferase